MMNILILTAHDLAAAVKNKTIFLIVFIPFFVFFSLQLVDSSATRGGVLKVGMIRSEGYAPVIRQSLVAQARLFAITDLADGAAGERALRDKTIDGLLLPAAGGVEQVVLVVAEAGSYLTLSFVDALAALQSSVEKRNAPWIAAIRPLQAGGMQKQTLPTWVLMLVLLVGFIIMPAQVADEKEKKVLLGLLQTPMRESEWLSAKILSGMILIFTSVLCLHLLGSFVPENLFSYLTLILAGSFAFCAYGLFLGFLCRTQASARTLGVLFYLPHLLPAVLGDYSQQLTMAAPFLPSYPLYAAIKGILLNNGTLGDFSGEVLILLGVGLLASFFSYRLMIRRWLM